MINRRTFVALTACLVLTASTALAGGGSKKDGTLRVFNDTDDGLATTLYVFVDVEDSRIIAAANSSSDPAAVLRAFDRLGGKLVAVGGKADFKVKAGEHVVTAVDIEAAEPFGQQTVTTEKGETVEVRFSEPNVPVQ